MDDPVAGSRSSYRGLITPQEMRALCRPAGWRVARDLALIWVQIVAAGALYVLHPAWWSFAGAFVLIAGGQHGLALATHEFAHYSLLPEKRRFNDLLGTWLFGAPAGIPLAIFRHRHFEHHRTYSTDADPKLVYRHSLRGARLLREIVRGLTGYEFLHHALAARARHVRDAAAGTPGPALREALPAIVIAQAAVALVFALVAGPWLYVTLWLLPLVTLSQLFQTFRAIMEHRPLEERMAASPATGYYGGTPGPFVRSVRASWWERLLVCKLNFGFHAEHHLWPQVSYQYLPALRERLAANGAFDDPRFAREDTYFSTIYKLWRPPAAPVSR
jgi:fatty acid desaturase